MEITTTQYKHCDLVQVAGRVDSATAPGFSEALGKITGEARYRIVLDLSRMEFISSAGLRVLINTQKDCKRYNRGELVLVCVPTNIHNALDLSGFIELFKIFPDVLTGVGHF